MNILRSDEQELGFGRYVRDKSAGGQLGYVRTGGQTRGIDRALASGARPLVAIALNAGRADYIISILQVLSDVRGGKSCYSTTSDTGSCSQIRVPYTFFGSSVDVPINA